MDWYYALFVGVLLAAHVGLAAAIAIYRHRQAGPSGPLLRPGERNDLDTRAIDELYQRLLVDEGYRQRFLDDCVKRSDLPPMALSEITHISAERLQRLVIVIIRNLDDLSLMKLLALLQVPLPHDSLAKRQESFEQARPWCNRPQQWVTLAGLGLLLLMVLLPPWQLIHQRYVRIINGPTHNKTLSRKSLGYHWLWDKSLPALQNNAVLTADLRTFEDDIRGATINYARLVGQILGLVVMNGCLVWTLHRRRVPWSAARSERGVIYTAP